MHDDDESSPVQGRRQILRSAGALGLMGLIAGSVPLTALANAARSSDPDLALADEIDDLTIQGMCSLTPTETSGPYYLDLDLVRRDITEGYPGLPTRLLIQVVSSSDCTPIPGAAVDVWQCNAAGIYSGFANQGTEGQTFLRGIQLTNADGQVAFDTIYPGWYTGRTTHIHVKIRPTETSEVTTQMYFKQGLNNRVNGRDPYSDHGPNPTRNTDDRLFLPETIMTVLPPRAGRFRVSMVIGIDDPQD